MTHQEANLTNESELNAKWFAAAKLIQEIAIAEQERVHEIASKVATLSTIINNKNKTK